MCVLIAMCTERGFVNMWHRCGKNTQCKFSHNLVTASSPWLPCWTVTFPAITVPNGWHQKHEVKLDRLLLSWGAQIPCRPSDPQGRLPSAHSGCKAAPRSPSTDNTHWAPHPVAVSQGSEGGPSTTSTCPWPLVADCFFKHTDESTERSACLTGRPPASGRHSSSQARSPPVDQGPSSLPIALLHAFTSYHGTPGPTTELWVRFPSKTDN
jgi:hypothetical protein